MIDIIFATSFSDLFQTEISEEILSIDRYFNITSCTRKQFRYERIRDRITLIMRLAFVSYLSQRTLQDIRFSLENSAALKTLKSVRRMFVATTAYQIWMVPQLVDECEACGPNVWSNPAV